MPRHDQCRHTLKASPLKEGLLWLLVWAVGTLASAQVNVENVIVMGRNALSVDDNLSAIHYFNQAITARPQHSQAWYLRGYAKFVLEDYHGAEQDCSHSLALNPYIADVYQLRGLCRINLKDFAGASADYRRVLRDRPDDEGSRFNLAYCLLQQHRPDSASCQLDTLLHRSPRFFRAYMVKAQVFLEKHDTLTAVHWLDSMLAFHPDEAQAWQFKGQYATSQARYAEADSFLTRAVNLEPTNHEHYLLRAMARNGMNHFGDAISDYDRVVQFVPQHFTAHYNRGLLRALVGDDNRAIDDFTFVLNLEPGNVLARYNRALLREQTGNLRGAIDDYSVLLRAYPEFLYGYQARGQLRRRIGDHRGAVADESVVARAQLDMAFARPRRRTTKEVRRSSDLAFEHYDQLVSEDADTARIFGDAIFGKVQNTPAEAELLPQFALALGPASSRGYRSNAYLPEAEALSTAFAPLELDAERSESGNRYQLHPNRRLFLTAEPAAEDVSALDFHRQQVDTLLRLLPTPSQQALVRSALARSLYDYDAALTHATEAVRLDSTSVLALLNRATILSLIGQQQAAAPLAPSHNERGADPARGNRRDDNASPPLALLERTANAPSPALADLSAALALTERQPAAIVFYNRGCLQAQSGHLAAALSDFDRAIELDPRFAEAHYNRAVVRMQQGQAQQAIPDLSRAGELGLYRAYSLIKQANKKGEK